MNLERDNIVRRIFCYSVPATVDMFVNGVYNPADRIFVSYAVARGGFFEPERRQRAAQRASPNRLFDSHALRPAAVRGTDGVRCAIPVAEFLSSLCTGSFIAVENS